MAESTSLSSTNGSKKRASNGNVDTSCSPPPIKKSSVSNENDEKPDSFNFSSELSLESVRKTAEKFANDRNWNQYHAPRNLLLALVGEVGELSELFQWRGEVSEGIPSWSEKEKVHLGEEISDVLIYLVRLADKCNIDLPSTVTRKFELNAKKYPASVVHGSSKKYTEYTVKDNKLSTSEIKDEVSSSSS